MRSLGEELRDVVRPELIEEYDKDVANWLVTDEFSARTGGLFKPEFIGFRGVLLRQPSVILSRGRVVRNLVAKGCQRNKTR